MAISSELAPCLECDPETLCGAIRLKGTTVPLQALLETAQSGEGIAEFLDGWPYVSKESAEAVLKLQANMALCAREIWPRYDH